MDTLVYERNGRIILTNQARVVRDPADVTEDLAAAVPDWSVEQANPFVKWIAGSYVQSDEPNSNKQYFTAGDLEMAEYTVRYAPLNMVHKRRQPVGFFVATRTQPLVRDEEEASKSLVIEALSGLWSHLFPFESQLVDQADSAGKLFYSFEARGSHLTCSGPDGCGQTFDYGSYDSHCVHLKERKSVRHIVNPVFRGGALIIPPVRPGWDGAHASGVEVAVRDEAKRYAELTADHYEAARSNGADMSCADWEDLMASIVSLTG